MIVKPGDSTIEPIQSDLDRHVSKLVIAEVLVELTGMALNTLLVGTSKKTTASEEDVQ